MRRASEASERLERDVVVVMLIRVRDRTLRLPDRLGGQALRAADGGQHEDEAAPGPLADDDVTAARAREATGEREPQPGRSLRVAVAADAWVERALTEQRVQPGAVVADRRADVCAVG